MSFNSLLKKLSKNDKSLVVFLVGGYFFLTLLCFLLLLLPVSRNDSISVVDQVFLSVSIVSTTGLSTLNFVESYSLFGQIVSLFFIQIGGIGYMALSSFIILKKINRVPTISAKLLRLEFNLPERYPMLQFIYSVFIFTVLIEFIGTILLYIGFRQEGLDNAFWNAVFHSISAFCTAGFSLFNDSMSSFSHNGLITNTILVLSLLGSIGFIVLLDFWFKLTRKKKSITLTSKIILIATFAIFSIAAVLLFLSDAQLLEQGWTGFKHALFQSISAHTTVGFNNYDVGAFSLSGLFIMIIIMIIGASPAGTGGGIKTTSITAMTAVLISILKRRKHITFLDKEIPASNIYLAVASGIFYSIILVFGVWAILLVDTAFTFEQLLFEAASALSTVGLSTGITGDLSDTSKIVISLLMFIGRLGVLTFGFALISKAPILKDKPTAEDIAI